MTASTEYGGNKPGNRRGNPWRAAVWCAAAFLLLLPLVAMQFTREVNWTLSDFVVIGEATELNLNRGGREGPVLLLHFRMLKP